MKKLILFLIVMAVLPMAFADETLYIHSRGLDNTNDMLYMKNSFEFFPTGSIDGRSFVSIPEMGVASAKRSVRSLSAGSQVSTSHVLYGDMSDDFDYVRVSFTSSDKAYRRVRYIPKEFLLN